MSIPFVGKCFPTAAQFLDYIDDIKFGAWRPRYVTMHHTGGPSLKTWRAYAHGTRPVPITDAKWMSNLASYYGNELRWSAGPHFFFTPDNFCVLSLPDRRGVHAVSFNANSWGVECVGDFDTEPFEGAVKAKYIEGLACLHLATGLSLDPFVFKSSGLHFHRDDPKTSKTCPGKKVSKDDVIRLVKAKMAEMSGGSHEDDEPLQPVVKKDRTGTVNVASNDFLNVRDQPMGKSPVVRVLHRGDLVTIIGETKNGDTQWFELSGGDFVAARYVTVTG
jgi:hypothetical protein